MDKKTGKCTLILAPMFGGKTSYLLHILDVLGRATQCLYINHASDTRSDDYFSTHNPILDITEISNKLQNQNTDMLKASRLGQIPDETVSKYQVVVIDEAQFYPDLDYQVRRWVDALGIEVYVAGLSGDSKRRNFGDIHLLLPFADSVVMLRDTLCADCCEKGRRETSLFTFREKDLTGEQIQIGNKEFRPLCRECYVNREHGHV